MHGFALAGAEAERQGERRLPAGQGSTGSLDEVAVACVGIGRSEGTRGIELDQAVAPGADEAVRHLAERGRGVEGDVDGLRVVAVGGVRRRHRIRRNEDRVAQGGVDRSRVGAAVPTATAAVAVDRRIEAHVEPVAPGDDRPERRAHEDGVLRRVGQEVRDELVLAALRCRGHAARHPTRVERAHRVGHVTRLEIGEGRAVGDDELQRLAVPRQSFRARSKCESAPGPSGAEAAVLALAPPVDRKATASTTARNPRMTNLPPRCRARSRGRPPSRPLDCATGLRELQAPAGAVQNLTSGRRRGSMASTIASPIQFTTQMTTTVPT